SWAIAFFEYCFQVPANRIGYEAGVSAAQLKTLQEVITLVVFTVFVTWYLKEPLRWNTMIGFALIAAGATFVFAPWKGAPPSEPAPVEGAPVEARSGMLRDGP